MRIGQISKADSFGGGASRVAEELTIILRAAGYGSQHWVSWSGKPLDFVIRQPLYGKYARLIRAMHYGVKKMGLPEFIPFELPILLRKKRIQGFDIAHFHDLSSAISPYTLIHLAKRMPVVWTIHDCSPFTGGCLYPMGCDRFKMGCGKCPQIGTWPIDSKIDLTHLGWRIKRATHRSGIHCIAPSKWMADMAMESGMFDHPPRVISNGIDTNLYVNYNKHETRRQLGIPENRRVVLLSAGHISDERKGIKFSLSAIRAIAELKPFIVVLGATNPQFFDQLQGIEYLAPGYVSDPMQLAKYYSSADVFLFCSLADNQPLSIIEAMSSGTPLVGFATGGIPEMVIQDETGFLVRQEDDEALALALRRAFEDGRIAYWAANCRIHAVKNFSHIRLLADHVRLYEQLIEEWYINEQN